MRDIITLPSHQLIISCDNSGGIGQKDEDVVRVENSQVAYYTFRVAVMECISAGGAPQCVILQNFSGTKAWNEYVTGIKKGMEELELELPITGSTETNMPLLQSGIGITIIGIKTKTINSTFNPELHELAIIGKPLVGDEVLHQANEIAPMQVFKKFTELSQVLYTVPVGSKGIAFEIEQILLYKNSIHSDLDLTKSSGPSTCFIAGYNKEIADDIKLLAEKYFHPIIVLPID
ncbi:hypothetical protein Q73_07070 [Bacillus coahuilensis m2-6]|uniref:hypothetical protein n=1 Tax=Bacillus coahuilensis TaxID=408580 RepID=UPI000750084D|nr:hypothetical protein [Bacillus coahuilensis]KUP08268.1 hypothetical protein Q73_07070 [Bacillus coahuilensis m2-6]